ncbi:MAG: radical SAM protein [Desulfobacteraceae bacterium]
MDGILAVTYRCNAKCIMCNIWQNPSKREQEIRPEHLTSFPDVVRLNITGGEPFLRADLSDILDVIKKKAKRVVISSNGSLTRKTLEVMRKHRDVGIRISFDGIGETHDKIRGVTGIHQKALETLKGLKGLGIKDLGIAVTISDVNAKDLVPLFKLAEEHKVELATAVLHNAYYFQKMDNEIHDKKIVENEIQNLMRAYLKSSHPKNWFRAYFCEGIAGHMNGLERSMKCTMATDSFFIDPYGTARPCNVMDHTFGNIKEQNFNEIWTSPEADEARRRVDGCKENCWMIGSVGHLMRRHPLKPITWIARNKWGRSA